MRYWCRE